MPTTTLLNPMVPFFMNLPGGHLQAGTIIIINGEPTASPNRFTMSLLCGPQPDHANIAFQLAAQFDMSWVTRNSRISKEWGEDEGAMPRKFPFASQKPFVVEIFASNASYFVAVDGHHFCEYRHRLPLTKVDTLHVQGSIRLSRIDMQVANVYPSFPPPLNTPSDSFDIEDPVLPFISRLKRELLVGEEVQIHGKIKPFPNRFHINLQQGVHIHPHAIIPLHFNPRFDGGERRIVLNSWINNWGPERTINPSPLKPAANFLVIIKREAKHFEISVNGCDVDHYAHRISPDAVDAIAIDGDVTISRVAVV